ncbi:LacI family DNA-binding transcriptional regulator [Demequina sp. SYSU T0a273]|uniref:LacI family DNA-binding transcriptional regulator n=2 Tax=Demequina lignilytica TaxID=3051663 RepID=A0AB35MIC2_9MICO|nr:LacI family DNA-binding transcriptional regulator [Demequina sp. SYSU T0a273]MDN4483497.1 LacI family DNA-binding transcriptional regulator [Demequina sp. SYSU T0a273]
MAGSEGTPSEAPLRGSDRARQTPNIHDVAARAGVSYQTVSRVINDAPKVRAETRRRVLEAIASMDYHPSRAARTLNLGRRGAVTVVTHDTRLFGHTGVIAGIEESARRSGDVVSVAVIESEAEDHVRRVADQVSDPSAGAVTVIGFDRAARAVVAALSPKVPAVAIVDPGHLDLDVPSLWLDERPAAADATRLLLGLGHRTVHHVGIPSLQRMNGREAGWRDALAESGAPVPEVLRTGWRVSDGFAAGTRLAAQGDVTAVFCGNDELAIGVRRAMHEAGLSVPGDVSIVGFDDMPEARFAVPSLTTVRMDFEALGRAAHAIAAALARGEEAPAPDLPAPELVVRESVGPARDVR